jgi:DNA-binding transcriptional regulator LsrR (DeoR family)
MRVAYLRAQGATYGAIGDQLGISIATVARMVDKAEAAGWLHLTFTPPPNYRNAIWELVQVKELGDRILAAFQAPGSVLHSVSVYPSGASEERTHGYMASHLSYYLEQTLPRQGLVGCNWGPSLCRIVEALTPRDRRPELEFVPLFGRLGIPRNAPNHADSIRWDASRIAKEFATRFGSRMPPMTLSFRAFIPERFGVGDHAAVITDYVQDDQSYQDVFGPQGSVHLLSTIITGLGSRQGAWRRFRAWIGDEKTELPDAIVGDLAQHFVTAAGVAGEVTSAVQSLNQRVVGFAPHHLIRLAARSANRPGLGVIAVAEGQLKAGIAAAAIRSGAVNHLFVDEELAHALLACVATGS